MPSIYPVTPKVLRFPADRIEFPKSETWLNNFASQRSYATNWAGLGFMLDSATAPLPAPNWGVGVFFNARNFAPSSVNWEPRGYKVSQVPEQAGTIMLAEHVGTGSHIKGQIPITSVLDEAAADNR